MKSNSACLFSNLSDQKARQLAWIVVGFAFYLLPLVFYTFKDVQISGGDVSLWMPEGTVEREIYNDFAERFSSHDSLIVSWEGAAAEDPWFDQIIEGIIRADRTRAFQTGEDPYIGNIASLGAFIDSFGDPVASDEARRKAVRELVAGYFTSLDAETGVLMIESTAHGADKRKETFRLVDGVVREVLPESVSPLYAGPCYLAICANEETRKILGMVAPLTALISLAVAFFFLRSVVLSLLAFGISGMAAASVVAAIHFSGHKMGDMLAVVPSLAQLLAMSNVIHLINYYMESLHKGGIVSAPGGNPFPMDGCRRWRLR